MAGLASISQMMVSTARKAGTPKANQSRKSKKYCDGSGEEAVAAELAQNDNLVAGDEQTICHFTPDEAIAAEN